jgi:uncharacterized protein YoxC
MAKKPRDELDVGIKKLLDSLHGDEIDEKIEEKFAELKAEMGPRQEADVTPLIAGMRDLRERLAKAEAKLAKSGDIAMKAEPVDRAELWSDVQSEIDRLASEIKEDAAKSNDMIEDLQNQLSGIRDLFKEMRRIQEELKGVDIKGLTREVESLKQKLSWLEQNTGANDIGMLRERIEDIEAELRGARRGSALVIE